MITVIILVVSCLLAMAFRSRFISSEHLPPLYVFVMEVLIAVAFNVLLTAAYKGIFQ